MRTVSMKNRGIILIFFIFLFFYLHNYLHPMSFGDDYLYAFIWTGQPMAAPLPEDAVRVSSWNDLFKSQWLLYFTWGGRLVGQSLTQFFVWLGKDIFNFFNALVSTILIVEIYWCANKGDISFHLDHRRICFIFFSLWAFTPGFNPVFLWLTAACIYVWPTMFLLAFLLPYIRKYYNYHSQIGSGTVFNAGMFLLGIIAGFGNENCICWIIIVLSLFLFFYRKCRGRETWLYTGVTGIMIGYALLMLAPGNLVRLHVEYGVDWFSINVLNKNLKALAVVLTFQLMLWYFNLKSLYIMHKEKSRRKALNNDIYLTGVFCLFSLLMSMTMLFSPFFPPRSGFPGTILLIIASAILLRLQNEIAIVLIPKAAKSFLFVVGIFYFLITSYVTIQHSYGIYLQMNAMIDEARKLQASSSKEVLVVKPIKESDQLTDLLSGYHLSSFGLSDDMNDWRNVSFARYYSITGIKKSK